MKTFRAFAVAIAAVGTVSVVGACASGAAGSATQAGRASPRSNAALLSADEIATAPGITNAYEAVQMLRPQFLRARGGGGSRPGTILGPGAEGALTGRRPGDTPAPGSNNEPSREGTASAIAGGRQAPEDPGILVYLDRQRYGKVSTLREIPVTQIAEIRFLNVGEANSEFGMGHPHGVIQVITKRSHQQ